MGNGYREGADAPPGNPWTRLAQKEDWDALVLRAEPLEQLRSIPAELRARNKAARQDEDGAQRQGLRVLLASGVEGSGRTLATCLVAGEVGGAVLRVDVSAALRGRRVDQLMLEDLFAAAESTGSVVLLHRTERLLLAREWRGPRGSDTLGAADVMDIAERHGVLVVFASASTGQLDPAALARFDKVVHFPFPNEAERASIWRRQLGPGADLEPAEIELIASAFKLPGGAIAECSRHASDLAAHAGVAVGLAQVVSALEDEYRRRLASDATREVLRQLRRGVDAPGRGRYGVEPLPPGPTSTPRPLEPAPLEPVPRKPVPREPFPREYAPDPTPPERLEPAPQEHAPEPTLPSLRREPMPNREPMPGPEPTPGRVPMPDSEPAPAYTSAQPRRPPRRSRVRARLALALLAAVVIAAAAGGYAIARSEHQQTHLSGATTEHASVGAASVSFPSTWQTENVQPASALGLDKSITLAPRAESGRALAIGTAAGGARSLLPVTLLAALPRGATPETVTLGGQRFYKYPGVRLASGGPSSSVYALPTTAGTIIAACTPDTGAAGLAGECERILATLRLGSGHVLVAGPSATYAAALDRAIAKLLTARTAAETRLQKASTSTAQAAAAKALASAYQVAANAIRALDGGTAAAQNASLSQALKTTSGEYAALAGAAAHADAKRYRAAQSALTRATQGVDASLATLSKLGYPTG